MSNRLKIFGFRTEQEFKPYYEKENDFRRLVILWSIAAFIISPVFCYLVYDTSVPDVYFRIGISFMICFPLYMIISYMIRALRDKLIYLLICHLYLVTGIAFMDVLENSFDIFHLYCFYSLYVVILYVMQRLYPAILYSVMVLSLLIYGFQLVDDPEVSAGAIFGLFSVIAFCSVIVLVSRQKMINSVEDYSNYLKKIVNNPGVGYVLFRIKDNQIQILDHNEEAHHILSCSSENIEDRITSQLSEAELTEISQLKLGNDFSKTAYCNEKNKDTHAVEMDITVLSLKNGLYWLLRLVDVTQNIEERQELELREKKYRNLYYRNQAGVFTTDLDSNILDCNVAFEEMFNSELSKGKKLFESSQSREWAEILELISDKDTLRNYQTHFTLKDGTTKWFIFNWYIDKSSKLIEGTIIDLTEVQKAASSVRQSEEKYRLIFEESNDAILLLDEDKIIDVNRKGIQLFGIPQQKLLGKHLWELSHDVSEQSSKEYTKQLQKLSGSKSVKFNWNFSGNGYIIEAELALIELNLGERNYHQCVIHDLTERNITMRALDKSRYSFKSVLDNTPEGIIILSDHEILYTNAEAIRLLGTDEVVPEALFAEKNQQEFNSLLKGNIAEEGIVQRQYQLQNEENREVMVEVTMVATNFEDKESILIILKDVSLQQKLSKEMLRAELAEETNKKLATEIKDRIRAEKLLQEQFLRTKAIFDSSSNTLLLTLDPQFHFTSFNTHCKSYFWYLSGKRMESGDSFLTFFRNLYPEKELRYFLVLMNHVKKGESKQIESRFTVKGTERWIEVFINPIFNTEGMVTEISLVAHDITEKKKTEKEIIDSLKEKEVLLKEIHHRVKNNLQVISSILNLQTSFVKDKRTLEILEESRNRIRSMAIIHENLYRTTNFSSINFTAYLENLASSLISSYYISTGSVELQTDMDEVELVLDQAIPCGLLVNELITNAIKYAFPNKKVGKIFIQLKETGSRIALKIEDNGVGLPEDFDIQHSDTLGLQLVTTLVEQLDGEITVDSREGTKYLITFEKAKL